MKLFLIVETENGFDGYAYENDTLQSRTEYSSALAYLRASANKVLNGYAVALEFRSGRVVNLSPKVVSHPYLFA